MSDDELWRRLDGIHRDNPFRTDPNALPDQSQQQGNPAPSGFVADLHNASESVIIDDDKITITGGELGETDNTTVDVGGLLVTEDDVDRVRLGLIDGLDGVPTDIDYGLWINDGGLIVVSDDGTTIIDSTSQMYRILASGSDDVTIPIGSDDTASSTTLTGLGAQDTIPAHLSYVGPAIDPTEVRKIGFSYTFKLSPHFAASTSGGSPTVGFLAIASQALFNTSLDGSDLIVVTLGGENHGSADRDYFGVFNVLDEAAL